MYRIAGNFRGVKKFTQLENVDFREYKFCLTSLLALHRMRYDKPLNFRGQADLHETFPTKIKIRLCDERFPYDRVYSFMG